MDDDAFHLMSAAALAEGYRSGAFTPVDVAEYFLGRIEALDARLNAFCLIDAGASLRQAEDSADRYARNEPLSPLDGVPVAVKDLLLTRGWPTLRGSKTIDPKQSWTDDAPSVARLRESGAVLIGKTTTPEFGFKGTNDSPLTGVTRNPWNLDLTPGGSSGGSAAALAAGFAPLALGTDGGGSIRIPASFTGTFGLKPSFGRVAAFPLSPFGTLAHVGPMTRNVTDAALLLDIIAQADARDWYQLPPHGRSFLDGLDDGIAGARIACSPALGFVRDADPEVLAAVTRAAKSFETLGAHVEEIDPPGGDPSETFRTLWWGAAGQYLGRLSSAQRSLLDPDLQIMVRDGAGFDAATLYDAGQARGAYGSAMRQFMARYDFLLTLSTGVAAFPAGMNRISPGETDQRTLWMPWTPYSYPFNLTQQPAASIPCGFTSDGRPIGLQIVGRMFDDAGVLRAARAFERTQADWRPPQDFA